MIKNPPANAGDVGSNLVQEDPTCCGAPQLLSPYSRASAPEQEKPPQREVYAPQPESSTSLATRKPVHSNESLARPNINK